MRTLLGQPCVCPGKFNIERFYQAKPVKTGKAKLRVKAASTLSFARLPRVLGKLPRMSGSFDF
jgi:hypothetical protein